MMEICFFFLRKKGGLWRQTSSIGNMTNIEIGGTFGDIEHHR